MPAATGYRFPSAIIMLMSNQKTQIFDDILTQNGYEVRRYQVDLLIYSEQNQVIYVTDVKLKRELEIPVECNVLYWSMERIAETVVEALDNANARERR